MSGLSLITKGMIGTGQVGDVTYIEIIYEFQGIIELEYELSGLIELEKEMEGILECK